MNAAREPRCIRKKPTEKPWVILTSGGSQLLTQLAAMQQLNLPLKDATLYYMGIHPERFQLFFEQVATCFGLAYKGHLPYREPLPPAWLRAAQNTPIAGRWLSRWNRSRSRTLRFNPGLAGLRGAPVVAPFRSQVPHDQQVLKAILPCDLVYTADGVIDTERLSLPLVPASKRLWPETIWTPPYLAGDTQQIATPAVIPQSRLDTVYGSALALPVMAPLVTRVENQRPRSILFSQHLALSRLCSEEQEQTYYRSVIRALADAGATPIFLKAHPRDPDQKIQRLLETSVQKGISIFSLPSDCWALPIEPLSGLLRGRTLQLVTASSSAPLCLMSSHTDLLCYRPDASLTALSREVTKFSAKYKATLRPT